jgi:small GTP-binding protein
MPTNLPPDYFKVEEQFRSAKSTAEKIAYLEEMLSIVPKHKGTDKLRGDLRRRLSKLRSRAQSQKGVSRQISPYHIDREGAGQVVIVGPANVGKSALVATLTNATPVVAEYPFTTWVPTPGMMQIEDVQVQLIDTPPVNQEFVDPEMLNLIRRSDLVLVVVDLQGYPIEQLEQTIALLEENRILSQAWEERYPDRRRLTFVPLLVVVNKVDDEEADEDFEVLLELLEDSWPLVPASARTGYHLDDLRWAVFERLNIIRVYSKPPGREPEFGAPFVMARGSTVEEFAAKVHQDFYRQLKSARVWGSATFEGQMVGRDYVLHDRDVVELRI